MNVESQPGAFGRLELLGRPRLDCYLCGSRGMSLYSALQDRTGSTTGQWNLRRCPNPRCGLLWLDPMPLEAEIHKAYREYYTHAGTPSSTPLRRFYRAVADGYARRRLGYPGSAGTRWLGFLAYLHPGLRIHAAFGAWYQPFPRSGERLLDVGSGNGDALQNLSRLGWKHLEGVDVDPDAVAAARRRGLTVAQGQLHEQQYPESTFDVVTMGHVVEHVHDPIALLRECRRILKPGGRLVVATPNAQSLGHALFKDSWLHLDPPRHLYVFSRATLRETLARSGPWEIAGLRTTVHGAGPTLIASRIIRRGQIPRAASPPLNDRLYGQLFYYIEWAGLKRRPGQGEELLLLAVKPR